MTQPLANPVWDHDRLREATLSAYNRHLKRAGNQVDALDLTFHHLKHMGFEDADWEFIQECLKEIKERGT